MKDHIVIVGMSHKTAPVEIREKLAVMVTQADFHESIKQTGVDKGIVKEYMVISTCNRVEFLVTTLNIQETEDVLKKALFVSGVDVLEDVLYAVSNQEAVKHLFRVASGLDSMVVGEPQILGQIKESYRQAVNRQSVGVILNRLLHKTFSVAKKVRSETGIGCHAVSVSYAAVELTKKIFGSVKGRKILLIGAGEMAELAAEHFIRNGAGSIFIANRTIERALELAKKFKAETLPFDHFMDAFEKVDVVLSSTGAPGIIIWKNDVKNRMRSRKNKPLFFIDIAVPRDIDPSVNELDNVYLYDIDDLHGIVEWNRGERRKEAEKAEYIIMEETVKFFQWLQTLDVVPAIIALRRKAEEIRKREIEKTLSQMPHLSEKDRELIYVMTEALIKKMIHDPIEFLKTKAAKSSKQFYVDVFQQIFNIPSRSNNLLSPTDGCDLSLREETPIMKGINTK